MEPENNLKSPHPWRLCPYGEHWVREHDRSVSVSAKNPTGKTSVAEHCRKNPSHQEILVRDEIEEIAKRQIANVKTKPNQESLGFTNGQKFDDYIAVWTQFWNEIFEPDILLDPNLVKALVAQESAFNPGSKAKNKKSIGQARGLIQLTEETRKILGNSKGELRDYLITLTKDDVFDPNLNLAGGIRWLFHKRNLLSKKLNRSVSWEDAVIEYKGLTSQINSDGDKAKSIKEEFEKTYSKLKGGKS